MTGKKGKRVLKADPDQVAAHLKSGSELRRGRERGRKLTGAGDN